MKPVFLFLLLNLLIPVLSFAQQQDSNTILRREHVQHHAADTLLRLKSSSIKDSIASGKQVMSNPTMNSYFLAIIPLMDNHPFINTRYKSETFPVVIKHRASKDYLFYLLAGMLFILAVIRIFYSKYFSTLFRVFFNTSMRQSQLTDQLMQAKLPSLLFNVFFIISGGFYAYLLLNYYGLRPFENKGLGILTCIVILGLVYFIKFITLKFVGWVSGNTALTNVYIFIIYMINKIIGIFLIPFLVVVSFCEDYILQVVVPLSLIMAGSFFLLRFYKSYGLLKDKLKLGRIHFLLLALAIEVIPLLLLYKALLILLHKNQ